MDLMPLYELRDRLKTGAIAGTGLITEDFRLARALESMAPLEAASPVFGRIGQSVRVLLSPDCTDRACALLDALSLADAVLCTQGVAAVSGDVEPLKLISRGTAVTNAPYSVLSPLMDALTNSGGGRYSFVMETHEQRPELFQDYRVKNALVAALGASYSDLANQAEEWLSKEDESILPLLMQGFDPKGKRDMVRRIHVMEAVAGAKVNDFYLGLLDGAEKEVRCAAVYALRHTEENVGRLITLAKTEKGTVKKQAHWALAKLNSPEAWAYWKALAAKHPEQAADYMVLSTTKNASALVAEGLLEILSPYEADPAAEITKESSDRLQRLLLALPGKSGNAICNFYRRAAALGNALDRPIAGEKQALTLQCRDYHEAYVFSKVIPSQLTRSLLLNPAPELAALAAELQEEYGISYASPNLTAALLFKSSNDAYETGKAILQPLHSILKKNQKKDCREALLSSLGAVRWDESAGRQIVSLFFYDPAADRTHAVTRPLADALDPRWYQELIKANDYDDLLFGMIQPDNEELCSYLGANFYTKARNNSNTISYLEPLKRLGWTKCEGLAVRFCQNQKKWNFWNLENFFQRMPGSNLDKAMEAERVLKLAEEGKVKFQASSGLESLRQLVLDLKNADPIAL